MPAASNEDTAELLQRGDAGGDFREAVVPQRAHAALHRRALEVIAVGAGNCERLELLRHHEQLEDADPAAVAGVAASRAPALAVEGGAVRGGCDLGRDAVAQ